MKLRLWLAMSMVVAAVAGSPRAEAAWSDYRWGFTFGYGGAGIEATVTGKDANGDDIPTKANRAEGPLVTGAFIERVMSDSFVLGFEHMRGVNAVPFSTGVSFTGFSMRWYFFGPVPSMVEAPTGESSFMIRRFVPFLGLNAGLALADVYRDDAISRVSGSGTYLGIRAGVDYQLAPGYGIRPELISSNSSFTNSFSTTKSTTPPPTLSMFALMCSWIYNFK